MKLLKFKKGFSTLELMIAVAVLGIIAGIILTSSNSSIRFYELKRVTHGLTTLIKKARIQSVYSEDATKWSIRLFSDRAVMFPGTTYTEGAVSNEEYDFGNRVVVATTSLAVSTTTITFDRITGKTTNFGNITLWISSATTSASTITIGKTGIIETN